MLVFVPKTNVCQKKKRGGNIIFFFFVIKQDVVNLVYLYRLLDGHNVLRFVNYRKRTIGMQEKIVRELGLFLSVWLWLDVIRESSETNNLAHIKCLINVFWDQNVYTEIIRFTVTQKCQPRPTCFQEEPEKNLISMQRRM